MCGAKTSKQKDDTLNFTLPPTSLAQLCAARIAVSMLTSVTNSESFLSLINSNAACKEENKHWLLKNLQRLKLPQKHLAYLRNYLIFVASEWHNWYRKFEAICYVTPDKDATLAILFARNVAWTGRGQIDPEITARHCVMVASSLSLESRYRLACAFHLKDLVRQLWKDMVSSDCRTFQNDEIVDTESFEVVYWSLVSMQKSTTEILNYVQDQVCKAWELKLKIINMITRVECLKILTKKYVQQRRKQCHVYALTTALLSDKLYSARYFAKKCNIYQKRIIFKSIGVEIRGVSREVACFYFSMMERLDLEQIIIEDPYPYLVHHLYPGFEDNVYKLFKTLPSEIFLRIFHALKNVIVKESFNQILRAIADRDVIMRKDYVPPFHAKWGDVFYEIWTNGVPESYRDCVRNPPDDSLLNLVHRLYLSSQSESVALIMRDLSDGQRRAFAADVVELINQYPSDMGIFHLRYLEQVCLHLVTNSDDVTYLDGLATDETRGLERWKELIEALGIIYREK